MTSVELKNESHLIVLGKKGTPLYIGGSLEINHVTGNIVKKATPMTEPTITPSTIELLSPLQASGKAQIPTPSPPEFPMAVPPNVISDIKASYQITKNPTRQRAAAKADMVPIHKVFLDAWGCTTDPYWKSLLKKMSMGTFKKGFRYQPFTKDATFKELTPVKNGDDSSPNENMVAGILFYKVKREMSTSISNDPIEALATIKQFMKKCANVISVSDHAEMERIISENSLNPFEALPKTWSAVRGTGSKSMLLTHYTDQVTKRYKLTSVERGKLLTSLNIGVASGYIGDRNIFLHNGAVEYISGVCVVEPKTSEDCRKFYIDIETTTNPPCEHCRKMYYYSTSPFNDLLNGNSTTISGFSVTNTTYDNDNVTGCTCIDSEEFLRIKGQRGYTKTTIGSSCASSAVSGATSASSAVSGATTTAAKYGNLPEQSKGFSEGLMNRREEKGLPVTLRRLPPQPRNSSIAISVIGGVLHPPPEQVISDNDENDIDFEDSVSCIGGDDDDTQSVVSTTTGGRKRRGFQKFAPITAFAIALDSVETSISTDRAKGCKDWASSNPLPSSDHIKAFIKIFKMCYLDLTTVPYFISCLSLREIMCNDFLNSYYTSFYDITGELATILDEVGVIDWESTPDTILQNLETIITTVFSSDSKFGLKERITRQSLMFLLSNPPMVCIPRIESNEDDGLSPSETTTHLIDFLNKNAATPTKPVTFTSSSAIMDNMSSVGGYSRILSGYTKSMMSSAVVEDDENELENTKSKYEAINRMSNFTLAEVKDKLTTIFKETVMRECEKDKHLNDFVISESCGNLDSLFDNIFYIPEGVKKINELLYGVRFTSVKSEKAIVSHGFDFFRGCNSKERVGPGSRKDPVISSKVSVDRNTKKALSVGCSSLTRFFKTRSAICESTLKEFENAITISKVPKKDIGVGVGISLDIPDDEEGVEEGVEEDYLPPVNSSIREGLFFRTNSRKGGTCLVRKWEKFTTNLSEKKAKRS